MVFYSVGPILKQSNSCQGAVNKLVTENLVSPHLAYH